MRKLNKQQLAEHARISARLEAAEAELREAVKEAAAFADDIASSIDDYAAQRSERWQQSDMAVCYTDWVVAWQGFNADCYPEFHESFSNLPTSVSDS